MIALLAAFWMALLMSWILTPWMARQAVRCSAIAVPRQRDMHDKPTPRWGGAAITLAVLLSAAVAITLRHCITHGVSGWSVDMVGVFIAAVFACFWGMLDDRYEMSAALQIVGILITAAILVSFNVRIDGVSHPLVQQTPGTYNPAGWVQFTLPISLFMTVLWTGVVSKTVDAMDGLDGLAAGICAISAATLTFIAAVSKVPHGPTIALVGAAIVGACIGFLRFNTNPARIFMGSSGGLFLGVTLAALSMLGSFKIATAWSLVIGVLVLGVPIFDYFIVMMKRLKARAPLTGGDRRHLHHRLLDRGLSKRDVVYVIYTCTAILCSLAIALMHFGT